MSDLLEFRIVQASRNVHDLHLWDLRPSVKERMLSKQRCGNSVKISRNGTMNNETTQLIYTSSARYDSVSICSQSSSSILEVRI